jgi:hypothetical protein
MATLTKQLDAALDKLQDVHDAAIDADQDDAATKIEELMEQLRDIDFNEENEDTYEAGTTIAD